MRKVLYIFTLVFILIFTLSSCGDEEHTHKFGEWAVTQNATCTVDGTEERTCSCGEKETKPINALDHTEVIDSAIAATCTTTGLTEGKHCSVCNEVLVAQTTVDALDHTEVIDSAVAATCTETGLTEGNHCSVCNTVLVAQKTIQANGHSFGEYIIEIEPTCTTDGKKQHICSVCMYKVEDNIPKQHSLYEHKCTSCDYEDDYLAKFDVSTNNDGSIYAYIYVIGSEEYELCFYGMGEIKDFSASTAPYYPLNDKIKYVEFGDGITRIGNYTLFHWDRWELRQVRLPNTLIEIGTNAFARVNFSNGLILPSSLINIGSYAFEQSAIGDLSIPDSVKYIGYQAFHGADIFMITLGSGITIMEGNAFSDMHENTIFSNLSINEYKNGCYVASGDNPYYMLVGTTSKEITTFEMHEDTVVIYDEAFNNCLFLKKVIIPNNVKIISSFAFANCASLESITIPKSVTSICSSAFFNCNALTSIVFENATCWWSMPLGNLESAINISSSVFSDSVSAATFFKSPNSRHLYRIE